MELYYNTFLAISIVEKGGRIVESSVAALLLITSAVVIACFVVTYTVSIMEQTMNMENIPEMDRLLELQNSLLNQTGYYLNQTITELPAATNQTAP